MPKIVQVFDLGEASELEVMDDPVGMRQTRGALGVQRSRSKNLMPPTWRDNVEPKPPYIGRFPPPVRVEDIWQFGQTLKRQPGRYRVYAQYRSCTVAQRQAVKCRHHEYWSLMPLQWRTYLSGKWIEVVVRWRVDEHGEPLPDTWVYGRYLGSAKYQGAP